MSGIPPLFRSSTPPRPGGRLPQQQRSHLNMASPARSGYTPSGGGGGLSVGRPRTSALFDALVSGALASPLNPRSASAMRAAAQHSSSHASSRASSPAVEARRATPRSHELASIDLLRRSLLETTQALEEARAKNHELLLRNEHLAHDAAQTREANSIMLARHAAEMAEARAAVDRANERLRHLAHREEEARAEAAHWRRRAIDSGVSSYLSAPRGRDAIVSSPIGVGAAASSSAAAAALPISGGSGAARSGRSTAPGSRQPSANRDGDAAPKTQQPKRSSRTSSPGGSSTASNASSTAPSSSPDVPPIRKEKDGNGSNPATPVFALGSSSSANQARPAAAKTAEAESDSTRRPADAEIDFPSRGAGAAATSFKARGAGTAAAAAPLPSRYPTTTTTTTTAALGRSPSVQAPNVSPPRRTNSPRLSDSSRRYIAERIMADSVSGLDLAGAGLGVAPLSTAARRGPSATGLATSPRRSPPRSTHLAAGDALSPHALSGVNSSWAQEATDLEDQMEATKARLRMLLGGRPL